MLPMLQASSLRLFRVAENNKSGALERKKSSDIDAGPCTPIRHYSAQSHVRHLRAALQWKRTDERADVEFSHTGLWPALVWVLALQLLLETIHLCAPVALMVSPQNDIAVRVRKLQNCH